MLIMLESPKIYYSRTDKDSRTFPGRSNSATLGSDSATPEGTCASVARSDTKSAHMQSARPNSRRRERTALTATDAHPPNDTDHRPPPEAGVGSESNVQVTRRIETETRGGGSCASACWAFRSINVPDAQERRRLAASGSALLARAWSNES
jgi:hypothetical protein